MLNFVKYRSFLIVGIVLFSCSPKINQEESEEILSQNSDVSKIEVDGESMRITNISGCAYNLISNSLGLEVELPSGRQKIQIDEILKFSGLPSNFQVFRTRDNIQNALAAIIEGQRVIVFDEELLRMVDDRKSQDYWASMSILAHEIGHHLSGHTLDNLGSNHKSEMEADRFSGYVLFKMGAGIDDAILAMQKFGTDFDSDTHPSKMKRIEYIQEGWNEANRQRMMAAMPPPPDDGYEDESMHFYPHQILDIDMYDALYVSKSHAYTLFEGNEGIILKREKTDFGFFYEIMMTSMEDDQEHINVGEIFGFGMSHPGNAYNPLHHLPLGGFTELVMMPGRKILFTLSEQGNRGNYIITEVETIPRKGE